MRRITKTAFRNPAKALAAGHIITLVPVAFSDTSEPTYTLGIWSKAHLLNLAQGLGEQWPGRQGLLRFGRMAAKHLLAGMIFAETISHDRPVVEIMASYAKPGYGPALYDATLTATLLDFPNVLGVVPDRTSVTAKAVGVWKYYLEKRRDDVDVYESPSYRKGSRDIDYAFRAKRPLTPKWDTRIEDGKDLMRTMARLLRVDLNDLKDELATTINSEFRAAYARTPEFRSGIFENPRGFRVVKNPRTPARKPAAKKRRPAKPGHGKTVVQSIGFERAYGWTPTTAKEWFDHHPEFTLDKRQLDVTDRYIWVRQFDPSNFKNIRTIRMSDAKGITARVGIISRAR